MESEADTKKRNLGERAYWFIVMTLTDNVDEFNKAYRNLTGANGKSSWWYMSKMIKVDGNGEVYDGPGNRSKKSRRVKK